MSKNTKRSAGGICWDTGTEDMEIIGEIAARAVKVAEGAGVNYDRTTAIMDLIACHANGCPLRLRDLLAARPFDFNHDVFGIRAHIDRETGKLGGCFLPRYARVELLDAAAKQKKQRDFEQEG